MSNSVYPRFKNNKKEYLVYYPCKKNANSSAKLFFMKHIGFVHDKYSISHDKYTIVRETDSTIREKYSISHEQI